MKLGLIFAGLVYGILNSLLPISTLWIFPSYLTENPLFSTWFVLLILLIGVVITPSYELIVQLGISRKERCERNRLKTFLINKKSICTKTIHKEACIELIDGDVDKSMYLVFRVYYEAASKVSTILVAFLCLAIQNMEFVIPVIVSIFLSLGLFLLSRKYFKNDFPDYLKAQMALQSYAINRSHNIRKYEESFFKRISDIAISRYVKAVTKATIFGNLNSAQYVTGLIIFVLLTLSMEYDNATKVVTIISGSIFLEKTLSSINFLTLIYFNNKESLDRLKRFRENQI